MDITRVAVRLSLDTDIIMLLEVSKKDAKSSLAIVHPQQHWLQL
jgi:hypothetical protein